MNQPELGKKIAELRKSKGLTQEELVEKCNLNVRTLQRIESGEVTPRSYTLKMIFAALDYNANDLFEISNNGFLISNWFEQAFRYILDLFNLKTNKMKKITYIMYRN
jgi:transcriptional regulator with XRE-family HTH domain